MLSISANAQENTVTILDWSVLVFNPPFAILSLSNDLVTDYSRYYEV
ncbi:MAG: hypothetical protein ACI9LX_001227 [Paraglaciecola sp.]|jgi:hypothetical protein